jgi:murein DD-endopeptidase MepM/ murein hydrolase activator NlpD
VSAVWRAAGALAALLVGAGVAVGGPEISIRPAAPRPGEVVFITLRPEAGLLRAACSWNGRSYPFLAAADAYGLVLPVPMEMPAGDHHVTIYWKYADGRMGKATEPVRVAPRRFGVQHLKLSARQEQAYTAPEVERERELIGAALARVSDERAWRGSFLMPVAGRISTQYGLQRYVNGRLAYRHRGIDIAAPQGTPVVAAADGVVALAEDWFALHGQTVILDHGQGVATLYLHLSAIEVKAGQRVARGQVIGRVGSTGVATGPHLHYAVYVYGTAVDPLFWTDLPEM